LNIQSITHTPSQKFELEGSTLHYPPFLPFKIDHMLLKIKPDFNSKILKDCEEQLRITAQQDLNEIKLDIAELDIKEVVCLSNSHHVYSTDDKTEEDKIVIRLDKKLPKHATIDLYIKYTAGYYHHHHNSNRPGSDIDNITPRSGFHFIANNNENSSTKQAWTQGEMIESRYWFPCLDDPQVKFPREIQVTVPEGYTVISNGKCSMVSKNKENTTTTITWKWIEQRPISTYLTSVAVLSNFSHHKEVCKNVGSEHNNDGDDDNVPLDYYWPKDIERFGYDAMLTFRDTPHAMRFFIEYFGTAYPYEKYSQVAVDDFEFGGMENASCTTLTRNILHDKRASLDYTFDLFDVAHELSHQWFGDLVTCKEWSHTWLNEGFATFCEALYWENYWERKDKRRRDDEVHYKILQTADLYFDEAKNKFKRAIVTNFYKSPEELFDNHSYRKGGCVLHMLRQHVGDQNFKRALKLYLERYSYKAVETDDLRKVFEEISGESLQQFFNQWLYRAGHPELEIEYSLLEKEEGEDHNKQELKIKITQVQQYEEEYNYNIGFEFPLEVRVVLSSDNNDKIPETIQISQKVTEYTLHEVIPKDVHIKWISIDPEFKVLNEIKSLKITEENQNFSLKDMLANQLKYGKTIIERIQAARIIKDKNYVDDSIICTLQEVILKYDNFYAVSVEAANTLGSYSDKSNYSKSDKAYQALKNCFDEQTLSRLSPQVRRAVVANIGAFERQESLDTLIDLLQDESYFVERAAATAIGKCGRNLSSSENSKKKMEIVNILKNLVDDTKTFQNLLAQGAINGLMEFSKDNYMSVVDIDKIATFLIEKTSDENEYYIRLTSTSALGKFLVTKNEQTNQRVFDCLKHLLKDKRQRVKINACTALADPDAQKLESNARMIDSINQLSWVAGHDLDGFVRRPAEDSLNIIREWIKEWAEKPQKIDVKMREKEGERREYEAMAIKRKRKKEDYEKRLEIIRRPILEY
jgi:aminopeptidase N